MENSDLLSSSKRPPETENTTQKNPHDPPDGGFRAFSVLIGSFLVNGLVFGVINSYSVIYTVLQKQLENQGVSNSQSRSSLVGSLTIGATFFLSPVSGVLTNLLGMRVTAVLGGCIAASGMFITSFLIDNVDAMCFTYGIMYGFGAALAYTPSLAILGHYFKRYLGLANGIVTTGSSVFTVILPPLMVYLIDNYGLNWMFRVLAAITCGIALCGLLFKPISESVTKSTRKNGFRTFVKDVSNIKIWKNKRYRRWAMCMPIALLGYFVPYVHMGKFIELNFKDSNKNLPIQCIGITSGVGRLVFGYIADKPRVNRIFLQQISFYVIGCLTIILPFVSIFPLLIVISLFMGIFDGAFISLIGPIAFELVGQLYAGPAIGCMLGLAATPLSIGPPIAGYIFEIYDSYTLPFILAGISPIVGATVMFSVRFVKQDRVGNGTTNGHVASGFSNS